MDLAGHPPRDFDEVCDDGNTVSGDGCRDDCQLLEFCGDGKRDPGETCDDGNNESGDKCSADCVSHEECGNDYVDSGEECDVGGADDLTCNADCTMPVCGDGYHNPEFINPVTSIPEQCDDGGDSDECNANCTLASCGDGILNASNLIDPGNGDDAYGEQCDDGNTSSEDACVEGCKHATCGDSFLHVGVEACDIGTARGSRGMWPRRQWKT